MSAHTQATALLHAALPSLDPPSSAKPERKGQAGRIAVLGGSAEYTGAPYFAAISALRTGADLSFVFSPPGAAPAIKAYSPDLVVYPGFVYLGPTCAGLQRMHALVVGPGLGRAAGAGTVVQKVVEYSVRSGKILVLDADALWFVTKEPSVRNALRGQNGVFLTPNRAELKRMEAVLGVAGAAGVAEWFGGGVVVVAKGATDRIAGGGKVVEVSAGGAGKRAGGQGDLLAGVLATVAFWMKREGGEVGVAAGVCACLVVRAAAGRAFAERGRSMLASDVVQFIGAAVEEVAGSNMV